MNSSERLKLHKTSPVSRGLQNILGMLNSGHSAPAALYDAGHHSTRLNRGPMEA